jgi:hypothetical protein
VRSYYDVMPQHRIAYLLALSLLRGTTEVRAHGVIIRKYNA